MTSQNISCRQGSGYTNCTNCTNCTDCTNCTNCTNGTDCTDCTDCLNCTDCTDCTGLKGADGLTGVRAVDIYTNLELHILGALPPFSSDGDAVIGSRPAPYTQLRDWEFEGCRVCTSTAQHSFGGYDSRDVPHARCDDCGHETALGEGAGTLSQQDDQ